MNIELRKIGKRFNHQWIFKGIDFTFQSGERTVILGGNGSGKSTLLQILCGAVLASEGELLFNAKKESDDLFRNLSYAAPYLELTEELTWKEMITFHGRMKPYLKNLSVDEVLKISGLEHAANKALKFFSSGMKQRARLTLAILSDTPLLLLDEPLSNLDAHGTEWYSEMINTHGNGRTVVVCSNYFEKEYYFCNNQLDLNKFKSI